LGEGYFLVIAPSDWYFLLYFFLFPCGYFLPELIQFVDVFFREHGVVGVCPVALVLVGDLLDDLALGLLLELLGVALLLILFLAGKHL
jgi:hypothetical protein